MTNPVLNVLKVFGLSGIAFIVGISLTPILTHYLFFFLSLTAHPLFVKLNFLSRSQTWLPLFTLVAASLLGIVDDLWQTLGRGNYLAGGMRFSWRLSLILLIAVIGALWFYFPLEKHDIYIPFFGNIFLGWLFIPFFILVMLATFSGSVIDGIDGLSGGVMAAIFAAYTGIAFFQNQIDLAAFSAGVVGAIAAFF